MTWMRILAPAGLACRGLLGRSREAFRNAWVLDSRKVPKSHPRGGSARVRSPVVNHSGRTKEAQ
ncbi:MAG: hypothetical protein QOD72_3038 [Acidimicrobiaceae bacterium]|nr:hypothetical protein [Acidimicrobiaceae bacterium]